MSAFASCIYCKPLNRRRRFNYDANILRLIAFSMVLAFASSKNAVSVGLVFGQISCVTNIKLRLQSCFTKIKEQLSDEFLLFNTSYGVNYPESSQIYIPFTFYELSGSLASESGNFNCSGVESNLNSLSDLRELRSVIMF